jgi:MFS family permease
MRSLIAKNIKETFSALRIRNFRLFFGGQLISQIGTWLTNVALTLLVLHRTDSGLAIGLLTVCQYGPILLLGAWGGVIADRSDKRKLLLITQTLEMAQSFVLAALAFMHDAPLPAFYVTAIVGGTMLAFDNPARRAFVAEMVPEREVQNAVTLNSALMTTSRVIGPALAGVLVVTSGFGWCFLIDAISYLAVIASLLMMRRRDLRQPPATKRAKGQIREGLRYVAKVPELRIPLIMTTIIGTLTFNFAVVFPLFVEHTLQGSDGAYTALYAIVSAGSVVGALSVARRRHINLRTIIMTAVLFGISMLLLSAAPVLWIAYPLGFFVGLASIGFMTSSTAMVQLRAESEMRGRVLALQSILFIGTTPIGGPAIGYLCDKFGSRFGLILGGMAALIAAAWGYYATRRITPAKEFVEQETEVEEAEFEAVSTVSQMNKP